MAQLNGRDVDGNPGFQCLQERIGQPAPKGSKALLEHKCADLANQPCLLGKGNELHRRNEATLGILQAHQGFHAIETPRGQAHERLEEHHETPLGQGRPHLVDERHAPTQARVQFR